MSLVLRFEPARAGEVEAFLRAAGFRFERRANALFLARREGVTLTAYRSGKLLLTGAQVDEFAGVLAGRGLAKPEPGATVESLTPPPTAADERGTIVVHFDGLCDPFNPGGVATFGYLVQRDGRVLHEGHGLASPPHTVESTNNVAEYAALLAALRWLHDAGHARERILVRGDSRLIIEQAKGKYRVNAPHLKRYHEDVTRLLAQMPNARIEWVPREQNERADELSRVGYREALDAHPEWRNLRRPSGPDKPATSKQLSFLRALGVEPPEGLTSAAASRLIDEAKARRV